MALLPVRISPVTSAGVSSPGAGGPSGPMRSISTQTLRCLNEAIFRRSGGDRSAIFFLGIRRRRALYNLIAVLLSETFEPSTPRSLRQGLGDRPEGKYASKFRTFSRSPAATKRYVRCENPCTKVLKQASLDYKQGGQRRGVRNWCLRGGAPDRGSNCVKISGARHVRRRLELLEAAPAVRHHRTPQFDGRRADPVPRRRRPRVDPRYRRLLT